jgi:hypothetical protein
MAEGPKTPEQSGSRVPQIGQPFKGVDLGAKPPRVERTPEELEGLRLQAEAENKAEREAFSKLPKDVQARITAQKATPYNMPGSQHSSSGLGNWQRDDAKNRGTDR